MSSTQRRGVCTALGFLLLMIFASQASAQSARGTREARSENRRFAFKIERAGAALSAGDPDRKKLVANDVAAEPALHDIAARDDGAADAAAATDDDTRSDEPSAAQSDPADGHGGRRSGAEEQHGDRRGESGCFGTLFELDRDSRERTPRWRERLVNRVAPMQAAVHDEGRFVVTLDDDGVGGARHALVIYDEHGELVREFTLRELLRDRDWKRVRVRRDMVDWLSGARFDFRESPERFRVRLRWGRTIEIDLERAEIVDVTPPDDEDAIPDEVRRALDAALSDEPVVAADSVSGDELAKRLAAAAAEQDALRAALEATGDPAAQEAIRAKLEAAIQESLALQQQASETLQSTLEQSAASTAASPMTAEELAAAQALESALAMRDAAPNAAPSDDNPDVGEAAGISGETAVAVPAPNPAAPVNYMEWYKSQVATGGPNAGPAYMALMDATVRFEGDAELRAAALRGDAAALASPEIQTWIAANESAMALMREGARMDYRGVEPTSTDGSLVGILLPHLSNMREVGRAVVTRGRSLEMQGSSAAAREEYLSALEFGASAGQGPTLIENLVGIAIQRPAADALLDSLAVDDPSTDYVALAAQLEKSYKPVRPIQESIQFERAMYLDLVQSGFEYDAEEQSFRVSPQGIGKLAGAVSMMDNGGSSDVRTAAMAVALAQVGFERMTADGNAVYDRMTLAATKPLVEARSEFAALTADLDSVDHRAANPLLHSLVPALDRAAQSTTSAESQRRATLLVANLRAHRQTAGAYPASLDAFAGRDFLNDPITGQPFRYETLPSGDFRLYSVGVNGTDEGGAHDPDRKTNDTVYWPRPR